MKMEMNLQGVDGVLNLLRSLPPEVVSKRGGPVKSALRKAAQVIRKQAAANLQGIINGTNDEGDRLSTGLLLKNLIVSRGKPPFDGRGERYLVRVRRKVYPERTGKPVTTLKSGQILEYGSVKQAPQPWIRPASSSKAQEAINVATSELIKQLDKIVKQLAAQNKGR